MRKTKIMSKYFSFCNQNKKQQKQRNKMQSLNNKLCSAGKCLLALLVLGLVCFRVLMGNTGVVKGFEISELEKELANMQTEQKVLLQKVEDLKQNTDVDEKLDEMGLVAVGSVEYVATGHAVAMLK